MNIEMVKKCLLTTVAVFVAVAGVFSQTSGKRASVTRSRLEGTWTLSSIPKRSIVPNSKGPFVKFDADKKSAGGNTGCNSFGGDLRIRGNTVSITGVISTMMACEEGDRMSVERAFLDGLQRADRFDVVGGRLRLFRGRTLLLTLDRGSVKD